jgi:argininosuccinate synthase
VPYLTEKGYEVVTVTVDTGGFSRADAQELEMRSKALGAVKHLHIHAKKDFYETVVRYLIFGNATRGGYPLCVGAERSVQALESAKVAKELGAKAIAHGSTAAGNDQIRFEVAIRACAPELEILAPVRDTAPSRTDQVAFLESKGLPVPAYGAAYSVNSGLWGITIGGKETTGTEYSIPEEEWVRTKNAFSSPMPARRIQIQFQRGEPVGVDGQGFEPVELIERLDEIAGRYGIGRGVHLGETILGIKGRVAYEAPAAAVLLAAHRELEKLTLTKRQQQMKDLAAASYADMVHEGLFFEPACRDIEALLTRSQGRVSGSVTVLLRTGTAFVEGCTSPHSLHAASRAVYGEAAGEWTPEDARGFSRIYGLPSILHARAGGQS